MSFQGGRGFPRGPGGHGIRDAASNFRPQNLRPLPPQQPTTTQYNYGQPAAAPAAFTAPPTVTVMAPRPEFITYPPPVPVPQPPAVTYAAPRPEYMPFPPPVPPTPQTAVPQNTVAQFPPRPAFANQQIRPSFPQPPGFLPAPPSMPPPNNIPVQSAPAGQTPYPYVMPPSMPPPPITPQQVSYQPVYATSYAQQSFPPPPPPPPNFNSYPQNASSYPSSNNYWQVNQYPEKFQSERRSPERTKHYDDHRHREYSHGEKHRSDSHSDRRERGRSPDRRKQESSSRHRPEYERARTPPPRGRTPPLRGRSPQRGRTSPSHGRMPSRGRSQSPGRTPSHGRTPPRHRSSERSRERHRHRESRRSPFDERSYKKEYKRTKRLSQSPELTRKRPRLELDSSTESNKENRTETKEGSTARNDNEGQEGAASRKTTYVRCTDSESYYSSDPMDQVGESTVVGTSKLRSLYERFEQELANRQEKAKADKPTWHPPKTKLDEELDDSSESDIESSDSETYDVIAEIKLKKSHPDRLHEELWYNEAGQMNDGPLCKCSVKARCTGIRHSIYPGEEPIKCCRLLTNNAGRLHHYRITVSPATNFLTDRPTIIDYDDHEYIFEGFSMFSHEPIENIPLCNVIRFNISYTIHCIKEMMPENFCFKGLDLFSTFLFSDILELYDWNLMGPLFEDGSPSCPRFHFMPRFVRSLPDGGKEVLSMHQVLLYLLDSSKLLVPEDSLAVFLEWPALHWKKYAEKYKGMINTNPGMKPSSIRIDQLDREQANPDVMTFPVIVHFGIRPAQLSYAGDPQYQKLWKSYVKMRHLLANSPKVKYSDKQKLAQREEALQIIRQKNSMRREVTVELSSQGFFTTGLRADVCQHAMMLPVLTHHIRYHKSLTFLDKLMGYTFQNRNFLQLAMTHPSHHLNFGMNPDHARNSLSNCGIRQPKYGERKVHFLHMRKRGINTLINIMARLGQENPDLSKISHNERLELLGDAVVEFLTTVHLYYLFPGLEEGALATFRTAIVQNQHLAMLAEKLQLDRFMLYAHGPDLCRESDLRHAMANCFEALIGAVYREGGLLEARKLFGRLLFNDVMLQDVWLNYPPHPLQEPFTDRQAVEISYVLQKLTKFEEAIGVDFTHIRLLARAFTLRTVGFNHLTLGHNQRMEFLGDSIMQLVATEYLYIHFPDHHEGHLTLLRSSLVNNRTQAKVAEELGMPDYAITNDKAKRQMMLRTKTLADLMESFIAALFIDKDLEYVHTFMNVCFFPRLKEFILNQDWNDPKSQLQQCCLTLRTEGKEPDIPLYKTLQTAGPSHCRIYTVAVYFKGERIGCGTGSSIQQAEMGAALDALETYNFPQLAFQKRIIQRKYRAELKELKAEMEGRDENAISEAGNKARHKSKPTARAKARDKIRDQSRSKSRSKARSRVGDKDSDSDTDREGSRARERSHDREGSRARERSRDRERSRARERSQDSERSRARERSLGREGSRVRGKSRDRERSRTRERSQDREGSRSRERSRDREGSRARERSGDRDESRARQRSSDREGSRVRVRSLDREGSRARERSQERKGSCVRERSRDREGSQARERSRDRERSRARERSRDREGSRARGKSREREGSQARERSRDREGSRARERSREREGSQARERSRDREGSRARQTSSDREGSPVRERSRDREGSRARERSRDREGSRARERSRARKGSQARERSRDIEGSQARERSSDREGSRFRERSKDREGSRARERSRDREGSRARERSRDREGSRARERSRDREGSRSRERSRDREGSRVSGKSRDRERSRTRERSQDGEGSRARERSQDREGSRARERSGDREESRARQRSSDREGSRARERSGDKEGSRAKERSRDRKGSRARKRSRDIEGSQAKERSSDGEGSRFRERSRDREGSRARERSRDREGSRARDRSRDREGSRVRERSRDREGSQASERSQDREGSRTRERSKDREGSRARERSRDREGSQVKESSRDREGSQVKERSRDREGSQARERSRDREGSQAKESSKEREGSQARDRSRDREGSRARERRRDRKGSRARERSRIRKGSQATERSKDHEGSQARERSRDREGSQARERSRDRKGSHAREISRDRELSRSRERSRSRDSEGTRAKERERSRDRERSWDREGSQPRERSRDREQDFDRHRKGGRDGDRSREGSRGQDVESDSDQDKESKHDRDGDGNRNRDKEGGCA